jgi:hypothetical protein
MAKKETGEDILRTILEKGGMNPISSSSIQNAIQNAGSTLKGSISTPLTQSGLIPPPPITAEGSGSSKKSEALLENQKKTLEDIKKNTGNTAKMIDSLIKIQKTYNDDSKSLIKSLLESNEAQRIAVEENNRSKEASQEKVAGAVTAASNKSNKDTSTGGQEKGGGGFLDRIATAATEMFGIKKAADVIGDLRGGKNPTGPTTGPMSNAKPGPGGFSRLLKGGLYGGAAMAGFSLLGPDQQKTLSEYGVDSETAGVGVAAAAAGGPAGVLIAATYGLVKILEKLDKTIGDDKRGSVALRGNKDPDLSKILKGGYEEGATPEETEANKQEYNRVEASKKTDLIDAPFMTRFFKYGENEYLEANQKKKEQKAADIRADVETRTLQTANQKNNDSGSVAEVITPSTENISQQKANEIFNTKSTRSVDFWKNTNQEGRVKLLKDAMARGITGINPTPETGKAIPTPAESIKLLDNYSYEVATTQNRFNKITEEVMSTKPQSSAPVIINGGSTINNITTTSSGGGRGGGGGSPSRAANPWDSTLFGSKWEPYY